MTNELGNFENIAHSKDVVFHRTVKAPRKLVFEALTRPEHLVNFWAPRPYTTHNCKVDLRPGGELDLHFPLTRGAGA